MPAGPTFLKKGLGPDLRAGWLWPPEGAAPSQEGRLACGGGGSLTGRKAGLLVGHRGELPLLQQVPRASCSNPSGSHQQDGTAQAEGSLQEGTPLQTEWGHGVEGRQEELPGLLSWRPSS